MISIGIAGTAKNTGKTTALQSLLKESERSELICGITSIGYDGEWKDNITGLPKPRIHVQEGLLVAVASRCLAASSCRIRVLKTTGIQTALGEVMIGEVMEPGLLITAGPNKTQDLVKLQLNMVEFGCEMLFIDEALNRIIPLSVSDGLILSTGAALQQDIEKLAQHTQMFSKILTYNYKVGKIGDPEEKQVYIQSKSGKFYYLNFKSLLDEHQTASIVAAVEEKTVAIGIPGAIETVALTVLIDKLVQTNKITEIRLASSLQLIPGGNLEQIHHVLTTWSKAGGSWRIGKQVSLLAVTVNPFYPAVRLSGYQKALVDQVRLLESIRNAVDVPVVDIIKDGSANLWKTLVGMTDLKRGDQHG